MKVTVRCEWPKGFVEVDSGVAPPRRCFRIEAPNATTEAQALAVANAELAKLTGGGTFAGGGSESITPTVTNAAVRAVRPGDGVNTFDADGSIETNRMITRRVNISDIGQAEIVPTLLSRQQTFEQKQARRVARLAAGTDASGRYDGARGGFIDRTDDSILSGVMSAPSVSPFTFQGVDVKAAPAQKIENHILICKTVISFVENFTREGQEQPFFVNVPDTVQIRFSVNGSFVGFIQIPAGVPIWEVLGAIYLKPGWTFQVYIHQVGPGPVYEVIDEINMTVEFRTAEGYMTRYAEPPKWIR